MQADRPRYLLGIDVGSNSVGTAWIDCQTGAITTGISVFPAGVEESEEKRGSPRNLSRRQARRARVTLARRSSRKRRLRLALIQAGLLPNDESSFRTLLQETDPWELRRKGLDQPLTPYEFGRVLLHLAQRRGAMGPLTDDDQKPAQEDGKIKKSIEGVRDKMKERKARTFGEFIAKLRAERVHPIRHEDNRPPDLRIGPREWRDPVRNRRESYEHCADREMIRDEFNRLWETQKTLSPELGQILTDDLRLLLDNPQSDAHWRHKGLIFGQRAATWDPGTRGRCALHPTDDCVPHADLYASRYLIVEYVNNLRVIDKDRLERCLTKEERQRILELLSVPSKCAPTIADLRAAIGTAEAGWGKEASKSSPFRLNVESDKNRAVPVDWFSRAIIHGAIGRDGWDALEDSIRNRINRLLLKGDPAYEADAERLKKNLIRHARLDELTATKVVEAWKKRPKTDAKRLNLSRRAVRNLLSLMDRPEPWPDSRKPGQTRWLTQIEARRMIADDDAFVDMTTGQPLDAITRRRYRTGVVGATKRDRYFVKQEKHLLKDANGALLRDASGAPLAEPPPAPWISNPVVRKSIHEVRRHIVEYLKKYSAKPDRICIELAREARMNAVDADRVLYMNRLRNRIRKDIIREFQLENHTSTQQRAAVDRVILCVHQGGVCALCGDQREPYRITARMAANGENCEIAHIIPRSMGGHNGFSNLVLAHTKCNRDMGNRTPRQFWDQTLRGGFQQGMAWIERMFRNIERIKPSEADDATGEALWKCYLAERARPPKGSGSTSLPNYFSRRPDWAKIEQFKKEVADIQNQMTERQKAATQYAARQLMAYLSDALYNGAGLPERASGDSREVDARKILVTDGLWTARLRKEWRLFFDYHGTRAHSIDESERTVREEKNRADHRHHAVDAVIIALTTGAIRNAWEERERQAERDGVSTADEVAMEHYRRAHPIPPPPPFYTPDRSAEEAINALREAVRIAVYGENGAEKPVSHRPAKRKLVGNLHEESLLGPVLDSDGQLTEFFTARIDIQKLKPAHLAEGMPKDDGSDENGDPTPGKSGIVRDPGLRKRLREIILEAGLNPDNFKKKDIKKLAGDGVFKHTSGVPIRSVVLLRKMTKPVLIQRKKPKYGSTDMEHDPNPRSLRAYVGGNNHHIEFRLSAKGRFTGTLVTAFEAAQRNLARLRALRAAGVPDGKRLRELPRAKRRAFSRTIAEIEALYPIVDRRDDPKRGRFVMSVSEGEMLWMRHKITKEVGYFVVAKLDDSNKFQVIPHWDARPSKPRKDENKKAIEGSARELIAISLADLKDLAPPGHEHVRKVRVSPLGDITLLDRD